MPSREILLDSPLFLTDYKSFINELTSPSRATAAEKKRVEDLIAECHQLLTDLESVQKTIKYWDSLRARSFRADIPEPDQRALEWEDLDGDWELEARIKYASGELHDSNQ